MVAQAASDEAISVRSPADGQVIEDVPVDGPERVAAAAARLREAQIEWERIGVDGRSKWIRLYRDWVLDNTDRLADIEQREGGRVRTEALLEQNLLADIVNHYSRLAPKLLAPRRVPASSSLLGAKRFTVLRRPFPLVGIIGAWNYPLLLSFGDAVPALFAGAAVLLKPSEVTPLGVREAVRGWREDVGAPPVIDVVFGRGEAGTALIDEVDFVMFTGSAATGRCVAERASRTCTPVSLELGGKDPALVLRDANLKRAANAVVFGAFANNGQACISTERVYVESPVYDEFVSLVVERVRSLRSGLDGPAVYKDIGAMTTTAQLTIVQDHIADAVARGARVLTGGKRIERAGDWHEPTVLVDVDHSMKVMVEETFGPVLPIMRIVDVEDAVRLANDSQFGLSASIYTRDVRAGERLAERLDAGTVNVNDWGVGSMCPAVPMGGWKKSGIGARNAEHGLLKYTRAKTVSANRTPVLGKELWWFPYTQRRQGMVRRVVRLIHGRGLGRLGKRRFPPHGHQQ